MLRLEACLGLCVYLLLLCGLSTRLNAQKVGLVLSGGGGLGMAHIGAIKALEEHGIPIDYVTGTSAGALIGAFYAAGYTPEEMMNLTLSRTEKWLAPGLVIYDDFYFRKYRTDATFLNLPISFRGTNRTLPDNLVSDYEINFGLNRYLAQASGLAVQDFDQLFVPYRSMAADIFEKKSIILREGSLPFAVRASIAVPLFFSGVSNQKYSNLFDGGIYDNFPVKPMQDEFNPDIIIGIHVAVSTVSKKEKIEKGKFIQELLSQSLVDQATWQKMPSDGILIIPDLEDKSSTDFSVASQLFVIERGYKATLACIEDIKRVITRKVDSLTLARRREAFRSALPPLVIDELEVFGVGKWEKAYIQRLFRLNRGSITFEELKKRSLRLKTDVNYQGIFPELLYKPQDSAYRANLFVKPSARFLLRFGGSFFTPTDHQIMLGADYQGVTSFAAYRAELELMRGSYTNHAIVRGQFVLPTRTPLAIELENSIVQWDLQQLFFSLFNADKSADISHQSFQFKPSISLPFSAQSKLSLGLGLQQITDRYFPKDALSGIQERDVSEFRGTSLALAYHRRSFDKKMYPDKGTEMIFKLLYNQGTERHLPQNNETLSREQYHRWGQFWFHVQSFIQPFHRFSLGVSLDAAYSSLQPYFTERGTLLSSPQFLPFQDSQILVIPHLYSKAWASAGLHFVYHLTPKLAVRADAFMMHSFETLNTDAVTGRVQSRLTWELDQVYWPFSVGLAYDTTIGPIGVFVNYYDTPNAEFRFLAHVGYLLFSNHVWQ